MSGLPVHPKTEPQGEQGTGSRGTARLSLAEAIKLVMEEYDQETDRWQENQTLFRKAEQIIEAEWDQMEAANLFPELTGGATIQPEPNRSRIKFWMYMAFRLGMRVQRKLYNPTVRTSAFWTNPTVQ
jgi:hypothetical protein